MKRLKPLLYLFFSVFSLAGCVSSKNTMAPPAKAIPLHDALLWRIEGNGLRHPSYLFGTMHLIPAEDFFWPKGMEEAISNADKMVFEIDMDKMSSPLVYLSVLSKSLMRNDTTLKMLLSPEEYAEVSAQLKEKLGKIPFVERVKPFFLSELINMQEENAFSNKGNQMSYEKELYKYAKEYHIQSEGLETVKQQMSYFDKIPYRLQAQMLLESIRHDEEEETNRLLSLYRQQKISALSALIREDMPDNSVYARVLLSDRNRRWVPIMAQYMRKGSILFAVGAGHLGGNNGLLALLKASGYRLIPMSISRRKRNRIKL